MKFDAIPPEARDAESMSMLAMHPTWLQHKMTQKLLEKLQDDRKDCLARIEQISVDSKSNDVALRIEGIRLREINNTLRKIYDVQEYIRKS